MKTRYLHKNRYDVYCLRFELLSKPENKYRQLLISLKTKEYHAALKLYGDIMPAVCGILCEYSNNLRNSVSEAPNVSQIKRTIRDQVKRIVEAETDPSVKKWMSDIRYRKLDSYLDETFSLFELDQNETRILRRNLSDSQSKESKLLAALTHSASTAPALNSESQPIGELIDDYFKFKEKTWVTRTAKQALSNLIRFAEIIGFETNSSAIDGKLIQKYTNIISRLPKNIGRKRKELFTTDSSLISKWWEDSSTSHTEEVLASGGIEKHFSDVRMLLKWLHERHYIALDYSKHLEVAKPKGSNKIEKRAMYETGHLAQIFSSYVYSETLKKREAPKSYHFWAPLIALQTGMRISEIASLEVQDVQSIDGVFAFSVNEEWQSSDLIKSIFSKAKKTKESLRKIPIPEAVLNAGLLDFIGKRETGLLFDDLQLSSTKGLGNSISKWYNEYFVRYANVPKQNDKGIPIAFHSFRHTFTFLLDKTLVQGQPLRRNESFYVTGHRDDSVRTQTYNHDSYSLSLIKTYIDAIDFGIDFNQLTYDRFVNRHREKVYKNRTSVQ